MHVTLKPAALALASALLLAAGVATPQPLPGFRPIPRPAQPTARTALEPALAAVDQNEQIAARQCAEDVQAAAKRFGDRTLRPLHDRRYRVQLETPALYSVSSYVRGNCFGAHPYESDESFTFDVTEGKAYDLRRLYRIVGGEKQHLLPPFRDTLRKALLKARGARVSTECERVLNEDPLENVEPISLALTAAGLRIAYFGPRVAQVCYRPVVLSYPSLRPYLDGGEASRLGWTR